MLFLKFRMDAYFVCRAVHHACYLDDWATSQFKFSYDLSLDQKAGVSNLGTPIVKMISWRRLEIVRDILAMGVNVLAVDADIAYFRCTSIIHVYWYGSSCNPRSRQYSRRRKIITVLDCPMNTNVIICSSRPREVGALSDS